jgi:hypothetical protein
MLGEPAQLILGIFTDKIGGIDPVEKVPRKNKKVWSHLQHLRDEMIKGTAEIHHPHVQPGIWINFLVAGYAKMGIGRVYDHSSA